VSMTTPPALLATSQLRVTLALAAIPRSDRLTPKALPVTLTVGRRTCRAKGLPATLPVPKAKQVVPGSWPAIQHRTHVTAPAPRPASLATLKTTKYPPGNPVTAENKGGSKPLVVKPTVKPTRLPLQQPAQGRLNQWGRSKTNLGNDGLTLSSS